MSTARTWVLYVAFLALLGAPLLAFAADTTTDTSTTAAPTQVTGSGTTDYSGTYAYQRDGVFGCSLNGSYSMSVGALAANGGVYVPVNDAAVTLNTGYLVYKECILRGVVDRERESATSAYDKQMINSYLTGRGGQPYFSQSIPSEQLGVASQSVLNSLNDGTLNSLNPAIKAAVSRAIAQGYYAAVNKPNAAFACTDPNMSSVYTGQPAESIWSALGSVGTPGCDPLFAYDLSNSQVLGAAAYKVNNMMTQLQWYNGNYPIVTTDAYGNTTVVTPGSIVGSNAIQALQSGYKQLESANDIDQMVGALFAGITSQVMGDSRGLVGLTQSTGGQPSYLNQVVQESQTGLVNQISTVGIQQLSAAQQAESAYNQIETSIANTLLQTVATLRGTENTCWKLIIQNVCATSLTASNTCAAKAGTCTTDTEGTVTCPQGVTLQVATSTAFSQAVINSQISPLAASTQQNLSTSNSALTQFAQLLAGVTNTSSTDALRIAMEQLDALVAQKSIHTSIDVQNAQLSQQNVQGSMATLVTSTQGAWTGDPNATSANLSWDGSTSPGVGWCNVNNPATIQAWIQKWTK